MPQGSELFVKYDVSVNKDNLKQAVQVALSVGQWYTGKERKVIEITIFMVIKLFLWLIELFSGNCERSEALH